MPLIDAHHTIPMLVPKHRGRDARFLSMFDIFDVRPRQLRAGAPRACAREALAEAHAPRRTKRSTPRTTTPIQRCACRSTRCFAAFRDAGAERGMRFIAYGCRPEPARHALMSPRGSAR